MILINLEVSILVFFFFSVFMNVDVLIIFYGCFHRKFLDLALKVDIIEKPRRLLGSWTMTLDDLDKMCPENDRSYASWVRT